MLKEFTLLFRKLSRRVDDDVDDVDEKDEWEKGDEDDNWDPDFDEFDVPKSAAKKSIGKKPGKDEDDDFKIEDDFKDLGFDDLDGGGSFDDDDDF